MTQSEVQTRFDPGSKVNSRQVAASWPKADLLPVAVHIKLQVDRWRGSKVAPKCQH
jgi:hypothetical protein